MDHIHTAASSDAMLRVLFIALFIGRPALSLGFSTINFSVSQFHTFNTTKLENT